MKEDKFQIACPVCGQPLVPTDSINEKNWQCNAGHSFDRAKQGYLNLLLVQNKHSKNPGDDMEMVAAREAFLALGRYQPLLDKIVNCFQGLNLPQPFNWTDLGCGEGWYTINLQQKMKKNGPTTGVDISKPAILKAAKKSKDLLWLVASAANPPIIPKSQDLVSTLFTPLFPEATHQILKDQGYFLVVGTGWDHLIELREQIYTEVRKNHFEVNSEMQPYFSKIQNLSLKFQWQIESESEIESLFKMTPHYWKSSPVQHEKVKRLVGQTMTAEFSIQLWQKKP